MAPHIDFLDVIGRESDRLAECLARVSPSTPVPSCPEWTADDLLWHLTEVQLFWGIIVRGRLDDPDAAEALKPARPADHDALKVLARQATVQLLHTLSSTPASTHVWTWAAEQTAGFVLRRQAHEALIHRLDAELTLGEVTPIDVVLAADGVDEALRVMYGTAPDWGSLTPEGTAGLVEATDVSMQWRIKFGRFRGTSPNTGKTYDEDMLMVSATPNGPSTFSLSGTAEDLDRYLWGRADLTALGASGDSVGLSRLAAVIAAGVQ